MTVRVVQKLYSTQILLVQNGAKHSNEVYEKNEPRLFEILLPNVAIAIERAERAYLRWKSDTPWHMRNPAIAVYRLVGDLLMFL